MIMVLDKGNTELKGGLFRKGELIHPFRKEFNSETGKDLGEFLLEMLRQEGYKAQEVERIAYASVVPAFNSLIESACLRYYGKQPFAVDRDSITGLKIRYRNPLELGTDRVAVAVAGSYRYTDRNIIIVDMGTATTFEAVTKHREYLGGAIVPGIRIAGQALAEKTAALPEVAFIHPADICGRSTTECIQSGLYYGHLGAVREIIKRISRDKFPTEEPLVIGTGGFAEHFRHESLFDAIHPDLVLEGIYFIQELNRNENRNAEIQTA